MIQGKINKFSTREKEKNTYQILSDINTLYTKYSVMSKFHVSKPLSRFYRKKKNKVLYTENKHVILYSRKNVFSIAYSNIFKISYDTTP